MNSDTPVLPMVAQEERKLLARIESTRAEARRIVDEAAAQAQAILEKSQAAIAREMAEMRRVSERDAAQERTAILAKAEARLAELQTEAQKHAKQVAEDVLYRILPRERRKTP